MSNEYKIAFIYLEETHHLYHFLSVAVSLSRKQTTHILTYSNENGLVDRLLALYQDHNVKVMRLDTRPFRKFTDKLKGRTLPRKKFWYEQNATYILNTYDAVVFTDYHHHILHRKRTSSKPYFIKQSHGIMGRKYAMREDLRDFDFHLFIGDGMRSKLAENGYHLPHKVLGYPKIDITNKLEHVPIFNNDKPTILYTPHFSKPDSSWHDYGEDILDTLAEQSAYNTIFAPHVNLFNKVGGQKDHSFLHKYESFNNLHIDLGSRRSVEMAYINEADIYLGDASSQVLEFILNPRPCIFFNTLGNNEYLNKFDFWKIGQVVDHVKEIPQALKSATSSFEDKKQLQINLNETNVLKEPGSSSSDRYAHEIEQFLRSKL